MPSYIVSSASEDLTMSDEFADESDEDEHDAEVAARFDTEDEFQNDDDNDADEVVPLNPSRIHRSHTTGKAFVWFNAIKVHTKFGEDGI